MLNGLINVTNENPQVKYVLGYLSPELIAYSYNKVNSYRSINKELTLINLIPRVVKLINENM